MQCHRFTLCLVLPPLAALGLAAAQPAHAGELITNGGFETGDFTGWSTADQAGGSGTFFVNTGTSTPLSGKPTVGPAGGTFYAVSDQTGPGAHALYQSFTVPSVNQPVILSFDMFVNNWDDGPFVNPAGLDYTASPNEHGRVDLLQDGALPFDTGAGVIRNFYLGADSGTPPNPYTHYSFDITPNVTAGGTYILRFAEVDNQSFFNMGVDNVSVAVVPEPGSLALLATGGLPLLGFLRRRGRG